MQNREFYIPSDGIRLHAKLDFPEKASENGKYPLLIFFHGFTGHMEERHIVGVTSAARDVGYATLRVELYGHGKSEGEFKNHTLFKWLTNALDVMDYAETLEFADGLCLAGHSQGGLLTVLVGAMEEDRVRAIIPMSPALMIPEGARAGDLLGMTFDPNHIPDWIHLQANRELSGNYVRAAQLIYVEPAIRKFKKPVLLVHGDADEAVPVQYSIEASKLYENAKLVIIPGDTHCYDNHLDEAIEAVVSFLRELLG